MKQKLFIILTIFLVGAILIGLNAASYTQKPKEVDNELQPNRSTYNSGPTGTQAYYSLLAETGRKVFRWQESTDALVAAGKQKPNVFVVIGRTRREFTESESVQLMRWVSDGGRLVLIDRSPPKELVKTSAYWNLGLNDPDFTKLLTIDTTDQTQMTNGVAAVQPGQPTVLTAKVNSIQPSVLAAAVTFDRMTDREIREANPSYDEDEPPAASNSNRDVSAVNTTNEDLGFGEAPVAHFVAGSKNIVVDVPYGAGTIVLVSDPFIVSNGGISLVDNSQLAINLVATSDGTIAFDEFHQGFGSNNNRFIQFFSGTPVVAIFFQCVALVGLIFYSQSRRFARPVPEFEQDRLSKLEYVSAMAEMQQRTRSFDLAIENIYRDFRRRASRLLGLDNQSVTARILAAAIADRASLDSRMVEKTLNECEEIIFGEPTNKREVLALTKKIREFEEALGLRRRPRI